jgi:hypothetical protein
MKPETCSKCGEQAPPLNWWGDEWLCDGCYEPTVEAYTREENARREIREAGQAAEQVFNGTPGGLRWEFFATWHPTLVANLCRALQEWTRKHGDDGRLPRWLIAAQDEPTPYI